MKKVLTTSIALAALALALQNVEANTETIATNSDTNSTQGSSMPTTSKTWLGVSLSAVPSILAKHLQSVIPEGQGVMVQAVSPNSPAQSAGLKPYDILLSFNDQLLYSARQLAGLVAASKPNDEITFAIVRDGSKQDLKIKLGSKTVTTQQGWGNNRHPMFNMPKRPVMPRGTLNYWPQPNFKQPMLPQGIAPIKPLNQAHVMQQFESISIKSLDGDRYHAEVEYQENNGEKKKFVFEGKYDEVRKQIQDNKTLPESKKNSLLNALKNNPDQLLPDMFMNFPQMPTFPVMPSFDHFFDNQPSWFKNGSKL